MWCRSNIHWWRTIFDYWYVFYTLIRFYRKVSNKSQKNKANLPISKKGPFWLQLFPSLKIMRRFQKWMWCDNVTVLTPQFSHENIFIMDRYRSIFILALFATLVNQSLQFSFDRPRPYLPFTLIRTKDVIEDPKVKETATALRRATEILQEIIDHAKMLDDMKR